MEKKMRIGNALYYLAYALWLVVAAVRMTRIDDIVTFKYGRLVSVTYDVIVVLLLCKLLLQKIEKRQLLLMTLLFLLVFVIGNHTSVSKLWAFFWLTCCIGKVSEKKVFWIFFCVHASLMVLAVSLTRAGVLENLVFAEQQRNRNSLGYDYCAYLPHLLTMLAMVYCYIRDRFHIWEGAVILALSYLAYRYTDTRAAYLLAIFVVISVWIIRYFDIRFPVNFLTRLIFQAGPVGAALGMCALQYFYREDSVFMRVLNEKLNNRLILGKKAFDLYDLKLFGQKITWVGAMSIKNNPDQTYTTVDNSYLRFAFQYGSILMIILLVGIICLQARLLKQHNTVLLWLSTIFFVSCTINPELLSYKAQPFTLLLGYLLFPFEDEKKGQLSNKQKEWLKKLFVPFTWINKCIKKDKKLVLFYSNLGFRDNVRAVYEEMLRQNLQKEYHLVLSLHDYKEVKATCPKEVKCVSNQMALLYYLKAGTIFYSFGKLPIMPSKDQQIINLFHGMPLKRIGNMEVEKKEIKFDYFSKVLATSPFFGDIMQQAFSCEKQRVLLCGLPRTDALFRTFSQKEQEKLWYCNTSCTVSAFHQCKKIVWLPTYREDEDGELFPTLTLDEMPKLDAYLKERNAVLWIKLHPLQKYDETFLHSLSYERICVYAQKDVGTVDLYDVLSFSDVLITDYSSIYFDYLMLNRPIGFMVGDISAYKDNRGFVFDDYEAFMPGAKIENYEQLISFLEEVCQGRDAYKEERKKLIDLVHVYCDGNNANRLLEKIGLVEKEKCYE